jgi:predicted enzyme related to lactoylglutathione lyase
MGNPVVHFEIGGREIAKSRGFHSELFGWNIQVDENGYGMIRMSRMPNAPAPGRPAPSRAGPKRPSRRWTMDPTSSGCADG